MGKARYKTRNQNTVSFEPSAESSRRLGPISNAVVLIILVSLIGLIYLTQVTKTNTFSYEVEQLQTEQQQLKDTQKDLELTAARLQSIDAKNVQKATASLQQTSPTGSIQN